jgi:hypothetical protein
MEGKDFLTQLNYRISREGANLEMLAYGRVVLKMDSKIQTWKM